MAQLSLQSRAYIRGAEEKPPASLSGYKVQTSHQGTGLQPGSSFQRAKAKYS